MSLCAPTRDILDMATILVLNGPNLNLLGIREPDLYGNKKLEDLINELKQQAMSQGHTLIDFQTNSEGDLITRIQATLKDETQIAILNPGGLTHTSVSLRDALIATQLKFVEVHISNIYAREPFRQQSLCADLSLATFSGAGVQGYVYALDYAMSLINQQAMV